jgi:hypothetical protein
LRVEQVLGLRITSPVPLTEAGRAAKGTVDVRFLLEAPAPPAHLAVSDSTEIGTVDDAPVLQMGRVQEGLFLRFPGLADFVVSSDGAAIRCTPAPRTPIDTVRHLFLGQVLPRAMGLLREPAVHGSAVCRDDEAVAFLGPTGRGKSTLALSLARSGWALLADDCLLLRPVESRVEVVPSQVGARVWLETAASLLGEHTALPVVAHYTEKRRVDHGVAGLVLADRPARLRRLYSLDPQAASTSPGLDHLKGRDAFEELLQHVMRLPPTDAERLRREFEFLTRLVKKVVLRRLRFPWAFEQLPAVRAAIEADLSREP